MLVLLLLALAAAAGRAQAPTVSVTGVFSPGEHGFACFRVPSLVAIPGDKPRLLAFAEARGPPEAPGCHDMSAKGIALKSSTTAGRTWGRLRLLGVSPAWDARSFPPAGGVHNPTTLWDPTRRQLLLHYVEGTRIFGIVNGTTWQLRSTDGGASFLPRERVDARFPAGLHGLYPGPGAGIALATGAKRGRLVFPAFVFQGPRYFPTQETTLAYYSDDGAKTFQVSTSKFSHARPNDQFDEPAVVERADGSLLFSIRGNYSLKDKRHKAWPYRMQAVSTDCGQSFGSFRFVTDLPDPSCQASLLRLPRGPGQEPLLAFTNPANASARADLTLRTSVDGERWSKGQLIWPLPSAYSSMAVPDAAKPAEVAILFEQYLNSARPDNHSFSVSVRVFCTVLSHPWAGVL